MKDPVQLPSCLSVQAWVQFGRTCKRDSHADIGWIIYRGGVLEIVGVVPPLWLLGGRE